MPSLGLVLPLNSSVGRLNAPMNKILSILMILFAFIPAISSAENALYEAEHSVYCGASWNVAFYSSGFAHESVSNNCGERSQAYSKLHQISAKDLERMKKALLNTKFVDLPESIDPKTYISDEDVFTITVQSPSGRKTVSAFGLERAINRNDAQRFLEVWKTVTSIIKEPSYE